MFINKKRYFSLSAATALPSSKAKLSGEFSCPSCLASIDKLEWEKNSQVCPECNYHFPLSAWERIRLVADENSMIELNPAVTSLNPLDFPGYDDKLAQAVASTGLNEAMITGHCLLGGSDIVLAVMDSNFMMGSMGSAVGEKFCRAVEYATKNGFPLIAFTASGGARIQEGIFALMQMAKTSAALERMHRAGLLYISVLTHPTTGGVCASFATLADIIMAEPGALVGFTGPRVIKQTIGQKLPEGFQKPEFLLQHGMIDMIVERSQLRETLITMLKLHGGRKHV